MDRAYNCQIVHIELFIDERVDRLIDLIDLIDDVSSSGQGVLVQIS